MRFFVTLIFTAFALLFASPASAKKVKNVRIKNCTKVKVKVCVYKGGDKLKLAGKKVYTIDAGSTQTIKSGSNKKFVKIVALEKDEGCGDSDIFTKNAFRKARSNDTFHVSKRKAKGGNAFKFGDGLTCN